MTMTQTSPLDDPQVIGLFDNLRKLSAEVTAIDAELGTDVSGPIAARNKLAKELVTKHSDENVNTFVSKILAQFDNAQFIDSDEKRVAVLTALTDALSPVEKSVNAFLKTQVDSQPKSDAPTITDARKEELAAARSKAVGMFKCQQEMLKFYDVLSLPSDIEVPVTRRGSIGPRGAKFTKTYQYSIDGKPQLMTSSDGVTSNATLSNLAINKWAKELNLNTKGLRDLIVAQLGVTPNEDNEVELPDTWSVTLPTPDGRTLSGAIVTSASVDESPDDDDDDTNGGNTEEDAFSGV